MRSLAFLVLSTCFLALSFKSCSWAPPPESLENETSVAPHGPSPAPRVRSLPGSGKRNAYPMAEEPARPFNEMPRTDIAMAALAAQPNVAALRKEVAANPHDAPPSLLNGLAGLSEMADLARRGDDPEEAARFFTACALNEQTASAVRAVCVRHLWDLKGIEGSLSLNDRLPQRIKTIAGRLPSITK